jgi:hypothetical protein
MSEENVEQSDHSGEALYNILPAALSKRDEVWQDAEKARQLRSRLIEILNVPIEILGEGKSWRGFSVRQDSSNGRTAPRSVVGTSSGFDSPAALLTVFLSILTLLIQLHYYLKCQRCIV